MGHITADFGSDPHSELSTIIRAGLGREVDKKALRGLAEMQERLQVRQRELAQALMSGDISREEYIARLRVILKDAARDGMRFLSAADFRRVFGDFSVEQMVDISAFLSER